MTMVPYGTSGAAPGSDFERRPAGCVRAAVLSVACAALCVAAVCLVAPWSASRVAETLQQELAGEVLTSSSSSTRVATYDEAINAQAARFKQLAQKARAQYNDLERKSMALRKQGIQVLETSEMTRMHLKSAEDTHRRLKKRLAVEQQLYEQLVDTGREYAKKANHHLEKLDDLQERAFKIKFKEARLKTKEKTLMSDLRESHSFALKLEDQSVRHITRSRAMKQRGELGHKSMMLRGASEMKNAYDESDDAKEKLHKLDEVMPEADAYQKLLAQREEEISQTNHSLLMAEAAEEHFELKKAKERAIVHDVRAKMEKQQPVSIALQAKYSAQKKNFEELHRKALALHETALRARRESRMYKLKMRMLHDKLVGTHHGRKY